MSFAKKFRSLKTYKTEPILFFYYAASILYNPTALTKLVSDKLCITKYNLSADEFCYNINLKEYAESKEGIQIGKEVAEYIMYRSFITSFPAIFAALFVGPWLDEYKLAPKIALIMTVFAGLFEAVGLLLNIIFFDLTTPYTLIPSILTGITGGDMVFLTAIFVYAMKETLKEDRTFRFVIIELAIILASPTASLLGSIILPLEPHFKDQVRNYLPLLSISIVFYSFCLVYIVFVIGEVNEIYSPDDAILRRESLVDYDERYADSEIGNDSVESVSSKTRKKDTLDDNNNLLNNENILDDNNNLVDNEVVKAALSIQPSMSNPVTIANKVSVVQVIRNLFKIKNAVDIFRSVFRKREEKAHRLLWLTILIYFIFLCNSNGAGLITFLFVERAYKWPIEVFQRFDAAGGLIVGTCTTATIAYLHRIKLDNTKIIAVGMTSLFLMCFCLGVTTNPIGFYLSYILGSIFLCGLVGCRGFVSSGIIPENELGSVLSALSVVYALSPVFASLIYSGIFSLTIEFYVGTAYLVGSAIILVDALLLVVLHFKYMTYKAKMGI